MRASRLLQMLLLLQNRGRMTARDLSHELEVAPRTILRDVDALTEAVLGFRLPLDGLADWVRGRPSPGPADVERDSAGRVSRIAQSGWVVELLAWGEDGRPSRLRLVYPGIDIRLAIGEWKAAAP